MNKRITTIFAVILSAVLVSCGKGDRVENKNAGGESIVAAVSFLAGSVMKERNGQTVALSVGDLLIPSDILITGENAEADVSLKGYGIMKIGSSTRIKVIELQSAPGGSSARIGVEKGQVLSLINRKDASQNYEVVTPTAVAGVRGTVFLTSVEGTEAKPEVKVAVLSGAVAMKSGDSDEVVLTEGTQMVVGENKKIAKGMVRPLGPDSMREIRRLSVVHRTNVFEYNSMMEEIRQVTPELKKLEGDDSAEASVERRSAKDARMEKDHVEKAQRVDLSRHIKRDTEGDPIKLEPGSGFE